MHPSMHNTHSSTSNHTRGMRVPLYAYAYTNALGHAGACPCKWMRIRVAACVQGHADAPPCFCLRMHAQAHLFSKAPGWMYAPRVYTYAQKYHHNTQTPMRKLICVWTYTCTHANADMRIHLRMCMHTQMHACLWLDIYIHTHINWFIWNSHKATCPCMHVRVHMCRNHTHRERGGFL